MLSVRTEFQVRFNEVDILGIAWHGHYIKWLEDGREAFGMKYGMRYLDISKQGYFIPVVSVNCSYKRFLEYGDTAIIETTFINSPAAKLNFQYKIYTPQSSEIILTASTVQVFIDSSNRQLQLVTPEFFQIWKRANNLN